jgi:hypothetical protein
MGGDAVRARRNHARQLVGIQRRLERPGDLEGDLLLNTDHVRGVPVEVLGPEVGVIGRADELGRDAQLVTGPAHRALQDVGDAQAVGDGADIAGVAAELEGARPGRHPEVRQPGKRVQDLLRQAVGEPFLVAARAEVGERQDGHGAVVSGRHDGRVRPGGAGRRDRPQEPAGPQPDAEDHERARRDGGPTAQERGRRPGGDGLRARCGHPQAFGRQFQRPAQHHGDGEPEDDQCDDEAHRPLRHTHAREHDVSGLEDDEGRGGIDHGNAEHLPSLQLGEQAHGRGVLMA